MTDEASGMPCTSMRTPGPKVVALHRNQAPTNDRSKRQYTHTQIVSDMHTADT